MQHAQARSTVRKATAFVLPLLLALAVAAGALRDSAAAEGTRARLLEFRVYADAGAIDQAAGALRAAAAEAQPLLDGAWPLHAWSRTVRRQELASLREELAGAVADLERAVVARRGRIESVKAMRADVDYASTMADLDSIDARRLREGPLLETDAPAAAAELRAALVSRRAAFAEDVARNLEAVSGAEGALSEAGSDPRRLLAVLDAVLPRPARGDEAERLGAVRSRAAAARSAVLAEERLRDAEGRAAVAPTAREVREALGRIDRDPDLARPADAALAARIAASRASIGRRAAALDAWEAGVAAVEGALAAGEAGAAAIAIARLVPCDDRTRTRAGSMRASIGTRLLDSFTVGAIAAADRGDLCALERLADGMRPPSAAWQFLADAERSRARTTVAAIDARVDRALYDEFARNPSAELADRYLDGWPLRERRMAAHVEEWRRKAPDAPLRVSLEAARWRGLRLESPARTLEDRPDASVLIEGPRGLAATAAATDIREGETSFLEGASFVVPGSAGAVIKVLGRVRIDLRDAVAADPVATGDDTRTRAEWRSARAAELPVRDPLWSDRPHVLMLRLTSPGVPALPPYPRR